MLDPPTFKKDKITRVVGAGELFFSLVMNFKWLK
jgi:hypothetical protein